MTLDETLRYSMEEETKLSVPVSLDEPLILKNPVNLTGQGETVLYDTERATLRLTGPGPYLFRGLHFQHHYQKAVTLVQVEDGLVVFEDCTFSGACGGDEGSLASAILVKGSSRVYFESCNFHHNDRHLVARDHCEVTLRNCNMQESRTDGILLSGSCEASISELEIRHSGWSGICLEESGSLRLTDSQLSENGCQGLEIGATCSYQGARNQFSENGQHGLTASGSCNVVSDGDQFLNNGLCGLDLGEEVSASVRWGHSAHNKSHGVQGRCHSRLDLSDSISCENSGSGIALFEKASLNAEDLQCEQNELTGIQGQGQARATLSRTNVCSNVVCGLAFYEQCRLNLERSRVTESRGHGIQLSGECQSLIRDCEITENSRNGLFLTEKARLFLEGTALAHNGRDGLATHGQARLTATGNRLHENARDGLDASSTGTTILLNNSLERNTRHGLSVAEDATLTIAENTFKANGGEDTHNQADQGSPLLALLDSGELELPFQPEGVEKSMLEALARHGRLSELALGKVANTRRVGGAMENLIARLNRAGMPIIQHEGQGPEGVVYALKLDTSRARGTYPSEETIEAQIVF